MIEKCSKLKAKRNRDKRNPRNSKLQANIIGSAEPYVLFTVAEETGSDTDGDLPSLIDYDSDYFFDTDSDDDESYGSPNSFTSIYNDTFSSDYSIDAFNDSEYIWRKDKLTLGR